VKLVLTLLVRDEADVVDAEIAYHLNAGVDLVIAAERASHDGTKEVLASYERDGHLRMLRGEADAGEAAVQTEMARMAASEHGADWVINADAAEFWWPRAESLKAVLEPIPPRYTIVQALRREFVAGPGEGSFSERMTLRRPVEEAKTLRPVHRADPNLVVHADGNVTLGRTVPLRAWYPIEVLHFPDRRAASAGREDSLVTDTRLRDALAVLRQDAQGSGRTFALPEEGRSRLSFRTPDVVDDAAYAVECAAVGEVDLPRLEQYVAELEERVRWLEQRLWPRVLRAASRLVRPSREGR
jgi:hypothetical protein